MTTMSRVIVLDDENFKTEILDSDKPALVDFWAPWCGPCKSISPFVEALAGSYRGKIKVGKLNIDDCEDLALKYDIKSIPTLAIFSGGKIVTQIVGAVDKRKIETLVRDSLA